MLPVTVLSGLSTTWRDTLAAHLLGSRPGSVAVLHDADQLISRSVLTRRVMDHRGVLEQEEVRLDHPCHACAVREDVLPTLERVAGLGHWDEVLLGLPPALDPTTAVEAIEHDTTTRDLGASVRTDTVTTVADAVLLREHLSGDDLLADRGLAAAAEDRRSVAEVVAAQIEYADVIALAATHRVAPGHLRRLLALLPALAPQASIVTLDPTGGTAPDSVMATGRFDHAAACARTEPGSLPPLNVPPESLPGPTMVWTAHRPLHPARLRRVLDALVDQAVRSRGRIWLANRPGQRVAWASAGRSIRIGDVGDWPGPRSCQLALTGFTLDPRVVRGLLDGCLLTRSEQADANHLRSLPDPFHHALGPHR
jgi:G3E family GTPase